MLSISLPVCDVTLVSGISELAHSIGIYLSAKEENLIGSVRAFGDFSVFALRNRLREGKT